MQPEDGDKLEGPKAFKTTSRRVGLTHSFSHDLPAIASWKMLGFVVREERSNILRVLQSLTVLSPTNRPLVFARP